MRRSLFGSLVTVVLVGVAAALAAETSPTLIGARALIEKAQAQAGEMATATNSAAVQARIDLRRDLQAFQKAATNMAPKVAASTWLGLLERFWTLPVDSEGDPRGLAYYDFDVFGDEYVEEEAGQGDETTAQRPLAVRDVLEALPGPAVWSDLTALVNARKAEGDRAAREGALKVLVRFLDGDPAGVDEAIKQFDQVLRTARAGSPFMRGRGETEHLRQAWRQTKGFESPADVVRQFREALEKESEADHGMRDITLPPLVDLTTAQEADELLRTCLLKPGLRVRTNSRGSTLNRMKALALENIEKLPVPPWSLISEPGDAALFEAFEKRFPRANESEADTGANAFAEPRYDRDDGGRRQAEQVYVMALLKAGRVDEGLKRQEDGNTEDEEYGWQEFFNYYGRYGQVTRLAPTEVEAAQMFKAMEPYALSKPDRFPWNLWLSLGQMAGQGEVVVKTLTAATGKSGLTMRAQLTLWGALSRACLAYDRVDEAVAALRRMGAIDVNQLPPDEQRNLSTRQSTAMTLLRLGRLLGRQDLMEEGVRQIVDKTPDNSDLRDTSLVNLRCPTMLGELVRAGRYGEAEQQLLRALTQAFKAARSHSPGVTQNLRDQTGGIMGSLLILYEKAGRQADALWLLDESPWWAGADLAHNMDEVAPPAARVLIKAGRKADAERLLKEYLRMRPSDDEAYEALVKLDGTNLVVWLDELYSRDRFEERPLIWKAVALQAAGQLDEAEKVVRQALKVDPTDGEQEPGQRVGAYAVLAGILEAKKKTDDAKFFRNVVQAVRIAEEGDELFEAGLIARSLKKYEQAEVLFADAYCVQWRLAERLWAMGKFEEANKHYAIAFERMPEQFGQVASFCFGCQGVFEKDQSRTVAERVLTRLAETQGQRPQVFFLLGQLREAQCRYADAYRSFKRAVELDPDYLDVWSKLQGLVEELYLPKKERDDIVFRGMELDPAQRHFDGGWETVADIRRFWSLAARGTRSDEPAGKVLELKGTAQAIAKERADMRGPQAALRMRYSYRSYRGGRDAAAPPAVLLLRHQMVQALSQHLR